MVIYIVLLLYICILGLTIYQKGATYAKNKIFVNLSFFGVFLVSALRSSDVGLDTVRYEIGFNAIKKYYAGCYKYNYEVINWEILWVQFNRVISYFFKSEQWLLVFSSALILFAISRFIIKMVGEKETAFWPTFFFMTMFHYFSSMNLLRQYCAMFVAIHIYTLLRNGVNRKNIIKSAILLIIAFLFHKSVILYGILIIVFIFKRINRKIIIAEWIACVSMVPLFWVLTEVWCSIFPQYAVYFSLNEFKGISIDTYPVLLVLLKLAATIMIFHFDEKEEKNQEIYRLLFLSVLGAGFSFLTVRTVLAVRLGHYFEIFTIFLIPQLINRLTANKKVLYFIVFILGWTVFIFSLTHDSKGCVPYSFFW